MSKIVFINRYFYPDYSATSQLLGDLAFFLADQGVTVEVVTSRQLYSRAKSELPPLETVNGVTVRRIWATRFGRVRLLGRAIDYLTFYFSALTRLLFCVQKGDIVVAKTDPPLISVVAALVCKVKRAILVNWLQDIFPEVAIALGVKIPEKLARISKIIRNVSLKGARYNVVLGKRMAECVARQGVASSRIRTIHNWSNEEEIFPVSPERNTLRKDWGLNGKFVVGYSGNMGRAHDFTTILDAASLLSEKKNILFLFIGGGAQEEFLRSQVLSRGLTNVTFKAYQERKMLRFSLCAPDIHLITLRPELEGLIVPSKVYGVAAAGRPVIFIGDLDGEVPRMLREEGCGEAVIPGQGEELSRLIVEYAVSAEKTEKEGAAARNAFVKKYSSKRAFEMWTNVLDTSS